MEEEKEILDENKVLSRVADSVTRKPDEITVTVKPRSKWHRWLLEHGLAPKTKRYTLYALSWSNMIKISQAILDIPEASVLLGSDSTKRNILTLMVNHSEALIRVAAICLTNSREEPSKELIETIRHEFDDTEILGIGVIAAMRTHPADFMHSIILIGGLDILKQKEPTPEQVSPTDTGEIIARGDSYNPVQDSLKDGI